MTGASIKEFYIVVSERRGPAVYPVHHDDAAKAVGEAERLARTNRGEKFYVYKSFCVAQCRDVTTTALSADYQTFEDEIPF